MGVMSFNSSSAPVRSGNSWVGDERLNSSDMLARLVAAYHTMTSRKGGTETIMTYMLALLYIRAGKVDLLPAFLFGD